MNKSEMPIYQAAARVASTMRQGQALPLEALRTLGSHPEAAKAALAHFGATKVMRQLPKVGESQEQVGRTLILYKAPLPSEQQARLSYEYLLSELSDYLRRKVCALVTSESSGHVGLWLPEGGTFNFAELWKDFITEMTTSAGLSRGFGLVMNSSKLSDRGLSTLETPMVSEAQPAAIAAFYLANLKYVEARIAKRQRSIASLESQLAQSDDLKVQASLEKKLEKDREMQEKERLKYRTEFGKMLGRLLEAELEGHAELGKLEVALAQADAKAQRKLQKQKERWLQGLRFDAATTQALKDAYQPDPFVFMEALAQHPSFGAAWRKAAVEAANYSSIAANQLSTQKGDIYAKVIWEACGLLYGYTPVVPLRPLLSESVVTWGLRTAGDNGAEACYSCGRPLDDNVTFPSRRLLFESPDQRTQSGGSSSPVTVCSGCAALSVLSPVKFAPDTLVIRFDMTERSIRQRVEEALEQRALNELGASAGRYINISCTEREADGTPAARKLGLTQYAAAKLASLYPLPVLRYLKPTLYSGGQEISLDRALLVGVSVLMEVYRQGIKDGSNINMKLGDAIRLLERGDFVPACYVLARVNPKIITSALEDGTRVYYSTLKEERMREVGMIEDVHALVGLLMPFCRQLISREDLKLTEEQKWREVGKLIQSVDNGPTVFSYTSAKTVGGVGNLSRDNNTHFVFDQAKRLLAELGDVPPAVDKERKPVADDPQRLRVTNDLIARAYAHFNNKYHDDYTRKNFYYQVKLGLFARFPDAL